MDLMMKKIINYPNGTDLMIFWLNKNLILQGKIDTVYESDNCLEEDDPAYKEFYISMDDQPSLISLLDGTVVWKGQGT